MTRILMLFFYRFVTTAFLLFMVSSSSSSSCISLFVNGSVIVANKRYQSIPATFGKTFQKGIQYKARLQHLSTNPLLCSSGSSLVNNNNNNDMETTEGGTTITSTTISTFIKNATDELIQPSSSSLVTNEHDTHDSNQENSNNNNNNDTDAAAEEALPIVLLVGRGKCNFEEKARRAQDLHNVQYVIVYDDVTRASLVPMSATNSKGIDVGMLFVSKFTGNELKKKLSSQSEQTRLEGGIIITMDSMSPASSHNSPYDRTFHDTQQWMLVALSAFFTLMACIGLLIVCVHTGYIHRDGNVIIFGRFPSNTTSPPPLLLTQEQVLQFPVVEYTTTTTTTSDTTTTTTTITNNNNNNHNNENDLHQTTSTQQSHHHEYHSTVSDTSCAICIEEYQNGEKLRVLPCSHAFHTDCIVPWLTERHPSCPLCKYDVSIFSSGDSGTSARTNSPPTTSNATIQNTLRVPVQQQQQQQQQQPYDNNENRLSWYRALRQGRIMDDMYTAIRRIANPTNSAAATTTNNPATPTFDNTEDTMDDMLRQPLISNARSPAAGTLSHRSVASTTRANTTTTITGSSTSTGRTSTSSSS